jgi:hypothetical protein
MNIFAKKLMQQSMLIGHNNEFGYIATAMNENEQERYPIVNVRLSYDDAKEDYGKRTYFLEFQVIAPQGKDDPDRIKYYQQELMKHIAEMTNIDLPWKFDGVLYKFSTNELIPGRKYSLLPLVQ